MIEICVACIVGNFSSYDNGTVVELVRSKTSHSNHLAIVVIHHVHLGADMGYWISNGEKDVTAIRVMSI